MKQKLNYLWFLACTSIITIILIITNRIIYGMEKIYIADYMPKIDPFTWEFVKNEPWETVKFNRTISDMKYAAIIGVVLTIISIIILYKKNIIKKNVISVILSILMLVIPIVISGFILSNLYAFKS